ncbi:MAG: phenylalanine--tRNA ligase subunit alpha [bacterium]
MNIVEFRNKLSLHEAEAARAFDGVSDPDGVDAAKTRVWSRTVQQSFSKLLGELAPEERREAGQLFNEFKQKIESAIEAAQALVALDRARAVPLADLTMPARRRWQGAKHPVTLVIDEIVGIFRELGFTVALGPESESEWYNFGALNFPADHPALDMHDTLYLGEGALLRTHTSPVQVRTLQRYEPPIRILAPGTAFRRDPFDASHAPAFAQIEGLAVDEGISFVDLKATLTHFAQKFFGATRTRFRPSHFPFTEPSAEMDVECRMCGGSGCSACKGTGWMEILGSGMVHPNVLESAGVDSERYTGWAFGMGPARIAMLRYDLPDIRLLYDSDVRFLAQVAE